MKSLVHNYTVVSLTYKSEGLDSPSRGAFPSRPCSPFSFHYFALCSVSTLTVKA
jgi:hypothetical protein